MSSAHAMTTSRIPRRTDVEGGFTTLDDVRGLARSNRERRFNHEPKMCCDRDVLSLIQKGLRPAVIPFPGPKSLLW